ncbi:MAG TPA: M20 family metallopeptidase [Bryobacteraceae bacterium]
MTDFLRYATQKQAEIVALVERLVACESPSDRPEAVDRFTALLAQEARELAAAEFFAGGAFGRHLRLEFAPSHESGEGQILILGHADTVWPLGTLETMPFRQADGRLWGPGVLDMKAGLAFCLFALRALRDLGIDVKRRIVLLVVSDEEVGSPSSRALTEAEARRSDCVLVLEPGTGLSGKLKTARKGIGHYTVTVEGRAAHAGVDFESGASAIVEAARQVVEIAGFTDLARGTTVNPGIIQGGTRSNVVAAETRVEIDVRVTRLADAEELDRKFRALRPVDSRCTIRVEGGLNRPPMERTSQIGTLFVKAREIAAEVGIELEESATGGGSDGNFTAALGVPTLDGLGAVGEGAHAANESVLVNRITDRVALLAGLVSTL